MTFLRIKELEKRFGGIISIRNFNLEVNEGEVVGLIGPNGAGKTTLFNLITGFYAPLRGTVEFSGKNITGMSPDRICRKGIARTFQIPRPFSDLSVLQNVMVGLMYGGQIKNLDKAETEAIELLKFVGLPLERKNLASGLLNHGERKLLDFARALATKPKLLLMDEPTGGMTPIEAENAIKLMKTINENGVTLLVVEHIMRVIWGVANRIVVLQYGEKLAEGTPEEIVKNKSVIDAYLGEGNA